MLQYKSLQRLQIALIRQSTARPALRLMIATPSQIAANPTLLILLLQKRHFILQMPQPAMLLPVQTLLEMGRGQVHLQPPRMRHLASCSRTLMILQYKCHF